MPSPISDLGGLIRQGMSRSLASLLIKIAAAGLTYLMYVGLSRAMGDTQYGYFAFGLSLATILAIAASMGQQTAVLRYFPEESVAGHPERAVLALRAGASLTLVAGLVTSLGLVLVAAFWSLALDRPGAHLYATAALILPLAMAEYLSAALRAQGSIWTGLAPRDIFWRLAVPAIVMTLAAAGIALAGWAALLLSAALLAAMLLAQMRLARRLGYEVRPALAGIAGYWREHGRASRWFLLGSVLDSAAINIDTILVGLLVTPMSAGLYFNAARTAGIMTLFSFAMTLVVAPMLAAHYHAGNMRRAQAVTSLCAWAGFTFSAVVLAGFFLYGNAILSLFGDSAPEAYWVLMILSAGYLFEAAAGPGRMVMMMTGHEKPYAWLWGTVLFIGVLAQIVLVPLYGMLAAAAVCMAVRIVAFAAKTVWARRNIGIDPSLVGLFRLGRMRDRAGAKGAPPRAFSPEPLRTAGESLS